MFGFVLRSLKETFLHRAVLVFLLGCVSALSMAPASFWPVLFIGLPGLYISLCFANSKKEAFATGWLFGFGYFLCSLSWIGSALLVEGNGYRWAYPLAISGIPFGLAFFWGLATWLSYLFGRYKNISGFLVFCLNFSLAELARGYVFTGFPWNLFAYGLIDIKPLIQIVYPITSYGLTALIILWASALGFLMVGENRFEKTALSFCLISSIAFAFVYGHKRLENHAYNALPNVTVKIVPGHIAQADKWGREKMYGHFQTYLSESYATGNESDSEPILIVWPETAMPEWFYTNEDLKAEIVDMLNSYNQPATLISGTLFSDANGGVHNGLVRIEQDGSVFEEYSKSHLVPFGEYIPFQEYIPLDPVNRFSGFIAGKGPEVFKTSSQISYAPAICYEIIFPHSLLPHKQAKPDFIINVTNDAWYEGSAGPDQHFDQVVFRAIEYNLPIIRSANKGISRLVLPNGKSK